MRRKYNTTRSVAERESARFVVGCNLLVYLDTTEPVFVAGTAVPSPVYTHPILYRIQMESSARKIFSMPAASTPALHADKENSRCRCSLGRGEKREAAAILLFTSSDSCHRRAVLLSEDTVTV